QRLSLVVASQALRLAPGQDLALEIDRVLARHGRDGDRHGRLGEGEDDDDGAIDHHDFFSCFSCWGSAFSAVTFSMVTVTVCVASSAWSFILAMAFTVRTCWPGAAPAAASTVTTP